MEQAMITYAHQGDPKGTRYRQYAADPVPVWAVDVKPEVPELKPSHFCEFPWDSAVQDCDSEVIAVNCMKIMRRLGDNWGLTWTEYSKERRKDGGFSDSEKYHFDRVKQYVKDGASARTFSKVWAKAATAAEAMPA
jgi:hypothetical protein